MSDLYLLVLQDAVRLGECELGSCSQLFWHMVCVWLHAPLLKGRVNDSSRIFKRHNMLLLFLECHPNTCAAVPCLTCSHCHESIHLNQKSSVHEDYRLKNSAWKEHFCFWPVLFFLHCSICLWMWWTSCSGLSRVPLEPEICSEPSLWQQHKLARCDFCSTDRKGHPAAWQRRGTQCGRENEGGLEWS